jgi:tetratricopeptide (TPR) repeat protein
MNMNWKSPVAVLLWMALASAPVSAQQLDLSTEDPRPYARGVPKERQERARKLFLEGNEFFQQSNFPSAVDKYREALSLWDHPSIHYNLALVLKEKGKDLEVHRHFTEALRYEKDGPLSPDMVVNARSRRAQVENHLVRVEIHCDVPGTSVIMGGQLLFKAPGRYEEWVLPGTQVFRFTKEGYPSNERIRNPAGGDKITLRIQKLYSEEELTRHTRLWSPWKPFAVLGTGAVLIAGGGGLHLRARDSYRDFDGQAAACGRGGCDSGAGLVELRRRGDTFQRAAVGSYALGGALFATGAVLAFINRTHSYRVLPDDHEKEVHDALQLDADASGARATFRF